MRAVVLARPGGPEVLEIRDVPDPPIGPEDVLIRVRAAALNRADLLQRRGRYPAPPDAPADIPGLEFAGEVEVRGERVLSLAPGDPVMGIVGGGGHAEKLAIHERACIPIPAGMRWEEAAAIPEAFLTAHDALSDRAGLAAGEVLLVPAAASGVGTAAIQLAAVAGARVVALSRSEEKRRRLREMGVHRALDAGASDLPSLVRAASGKRGVDVVLELVGAASWPLDLEVMAERGRIVLVGTMSGALVEADLGLLMRKRLTVVGTVLRSRPLEERIALAREFSRRIVPLFESGALRPVVDRVLPLEHVAEAHGLLERNETFGKIVLRMGGDSV